jgi:hypothetical protein
MFGLPGTIESQVANGNIIPNSNLKFYFYGENLHVFVFSSELVLDGLGT